ncbi:MAG: hypothetical protein JSW50_02365 [Candidatus Latescibacterota bacterium]|nr:MAG: hypothetical protein JSW50_02365 [Candidatus Latescibacterota bacterium]
MKPIIKSKTVHLKIFLFVFVLAVLFVEYSSTGYGPPKAEGIEKAAELVSSQILLTRQKAMASNTRYRIHCDYHEGVCRIYRRSAKGQWVLDSPDSECDFPRGVSISPDSRPADGFIEIDETGAIVSHDVPVVLKLTDKDGTLKSIRISSSGMVQECSSW